MGRTTPGTGGNNAVLLGTVAIEPNRWGGISKDRRPALRPADWVERSAEAGFDGVELWENHALCADDAEVEALRTARVPISIWNSYASFDDPDDTQRNAIGDWVARMGCWGAKFNVGTDRAAAAEYAERLARLAARVPAGTRLLCECHRGTAADDPKVAAEILEQVGGPETLQAIVHLGEDRDYLDAMFDAMGERITHVHVNFLNHGAPPLREIAGDLRDRVAHLRRRGFAGSYTIEFVNGVGKENDRPAEMFEAALDDLAVLREVLG